MTPSHPKTDSDKMSISNEDMLLLPLRAYTGKVVLVQTAEELETVVKTLEKEQILGFDTETRPSFRRGEFYKVALVQLATPGAVYLIQIQKTGLSESFARILSNPDIIKAGVAIRDDIKGLQKFRHYNAQGFIDLSLVAREKGIGVESVKKLTALLLGFRISKSAQTSNWETPTLSEKQIEYAATDAWVCLEIYHKLLRLEVGS
jgi:ribonuclease D